MELPSHPFAELPHSQQIYQGKRFAVYEATIRGKSGEKVKKEAIIHPGAVVILPIIDSEHILMIKNERIVVGKTLWELPAGTLELNEPPSLAAGRELIEETGYEASEISLLSSFYTSPGICDEKMFAFTAHTLKFVGQQLEDTEEIQVEILKWSQIWNWIKDGTIQDGKTLATFFLYQVSQANPKLEF